MQTRTCRERCPHRSENYNFHDSSRINHHPRTTEEVVPTSAIRYDYPPRHCGLDPQSKVLKTRLRIKPAMTEGECVQWFYIVYAPQTRRERRPHRSENHDFHDSSHITHHPRTTEVGRPYSFNPATTLPAVIAASLS